MREPVLRIPAFARPRLVDSVETFAIQSVKLGPFRYQQHSRAIAPSATRIGSSATMMLTRHSCRPPTPVESTAASTSPACARAVQPCHFRAARFQAGQCSSSSAQGQGRRPSVAAWAKAGKRGRPTSEENEGGEALTGLPPPGDVWAAEEGEEEEEEGLSSVPLTSGREVEFDDGDEDEEEWEEGAEELGSESTELVPEVVEEVEESEEAKAMREQLARMVSTIDFATAAKKTQLSSRGTLPQIAQARVMSAEEARERLGLDADAKSRAVVVPDDAQLSVDLQGYQELQMDGVDFLIGELPDGRLNLQDTFFFDPAIQAYQRPTVQGELPREARLLQVIPWIERKSPDTVRGQQGFAKMKKVYMVGVASPEPDFRVKMDEVYCFQASTRTLSVCEVRTIGNPVEPILRIRADGVTIEDLADIPTPTEVSFKDERARNAAQEEEEEERLRREIEELEAQAEQMDELDDAPDVPDSDMA